MARKRKPRFDLRKTSLSHKEYWDEILRREGLTPDAGRNNHVTYVGNLTEISDMMDGDDGKVNKT